MTESDFESKLGEITAAFQFAEVLAAVHAPLGQAMAGEAAELFEHEVGELLYEALKELGLSEEDMALLDGDELARLVPELLERVTANTAALGVLGKSAVRDQIYYSELELGWSMKD